MKTITNIFRSNIVLILLLLSIGSLSSKADTSVEVQLEDIVTGMEENNGSYTTPDGLFTFRAVGDYYFETYPGDTSRKDSLILNYSAEFIIISHKHYLTEVDFHKVRKLNDGKFYVDANNGDYKNEKWIPNTKQTRENQMILVVNSDQDDPSLNHLSAVALEDKFTITYKTEEVTVKKTPYIELSYTEAEASIGQINFIPPTYQVYEDETRAVNITDKYNRSNFIAGQYVDDIITEDNRTKTQDPITGTKVSQFYNQVNIGDKVGEASIVIIATPKSSDSSMYNGYNAYYKINIPYANVTVTPSQTSMTMYKGETVTAPTVSIRDITQARDASPYFNVTYTYSSNLSDPNAWDGLNTVKAAEVISSNDSITITLTPKTVNGFDYSNQYQTQTIKIPVSIIERTQTGDIPLEITWPNGDTYGDANDNDNFVLPIPRITNTETGSDVTNQFRLNYVVTDDGGTGTIGILTGNNGLVGTWQMHTGTLASGKITIKVTLGDLVSNSYNYTTFPSGYTCESSYCYVQSNKRGLQVAIDPASGTFAKEDDNSIILTNKDWTIPTVTALYNGAIFTNGYVGIAIPSTVKVQNTGWDGNQTPTDIEYKKEITYDNVTWKVYVLSQQNIQYVSNWKITYDEDDVQRMLFVAVGWDQAHFDDGGVAEYGVTVVDKISPIITLSSYELVAAASKDFAEPTIVSIKDGDGNNIAQYFDLSYSITTADGVSINSSTGDVTVGADSRDLTVTITATSNSNKYSNGQTQYIIHVVATDFTYEIINNSSSSTHGKMQFTGAGTMPAGYEIDGVPGLRIKFGAYGKGSWKVLEGDDGSKYSICSDNVEIDDNNIPTYGAFYELNPYVNGFITLDTRWIAKNTYVLIRKDKPAEMETYNHNEDFTGERTSSYPLLAGKTYYMYNFGNTDGMADLEPLGVHGINFTPAFISERDNQTAITAASTFVNGYTGQLPYLVDSSNDYVTFDILRNGSSSTEFATIDKAGVIIPRKKTTDSEGDDYVKVQANVWGQEMGQAITKTVSYNLSISDVPSYIVANQANLGVGQQVTTTNIPTDITMTFGGWKNGVGPYMKNEESVSLIDAWQTASFDYVGNDDMTIDGFSYATQGQNNPLDEKGKAFDYTNISDGDHTSDEVPCRGTYLKFEPRESGTLIVYLLQNGICNYDGTVSKIGYTSGKLTNAIVRRPLFITDETGNQVTLDDSWVMDASLLPSNSNQGAHAGSYTKGKIRCSFWDKDVADVFGITDYLTKETGSWNFDQTITYDESTVTGQYANYQEDKATIIKYWKELSNTIDYSNGDTIYPRQEIIKLKQGFTLLSKAYVRYTFQVKAGKTYFVFQPGSKLSPTGFAFVPTDYDIYPNSIEERKAYHASQNHSITLNDSPQLNESGCFTAPETTLDDYSVSNTRTFSKDTWYSICLPYSMSETKFKSVFGDDALIITYDSLKEDSLMFRQHVYHMIVAGRPYFIKPSKDVENLNVSDVTIENTTACKTEEGDSYSFTGTYYKLGMTKNSYTMSGGKLTRYTTDGTKISGFRSYLKNNTGTSAQIKGFAFFNEDESDTSQGNNTVTAIEDIKDAIIIDNTNDDTVYDIQGRKIGTDNDTSSLRSGVYISKGKKVLVK